MWVILCLVWILLLKKNRHHNLLAPRSRVLLEKLTGFQLIKKFTAFTSARHLFPSWASSIQSIPPHPTYWRSILTLSSHLHLGLLSGLLPSGFPTKTLYTPLLSPLHATCPAHLILDFITRTKFVGSTDHSQHNYVLKIKQHSYSKMFRLCVLRHLPAVSTKYSI